MATKNGTAPEKLGEDLQELTREVYKMADEARKEAVKQLHDVAEKIRSRSKDSSKEVRDGADRIARNLEKTASKLNTIAMDQVEEAKEEVQENVWQTIIIAFIIGLVIGWLLNRGD